MNETRLNAAADTRGKIPVTEVATESFVPIISVWLVDDNDSFLASLAKVLSRQRGIQCAKDFSSPDAALKLNPSPRSLFRGGLKFFPTMIG